ncbi:MAG: alanine--tRNA ligase [Puniceicoccales bacterium]|jgi:alanyl-tRNA synthetase|nr:alanine--tRNA ligase [Puniceicoccales bacterium]
MNSEELRQSFLDFFEEKGHHIVPSASLQTESPNLLFTNAGMNPFVPIFLGERAIQFARVADTQKCIRAGGKHNDLEDVGFDTYHHTFFEMLGNWSFGDYFKAEAIAFAWELLTKIWHFPKERLYVTIYAPGKHDPSQEDEEAYTLWKRIFVEEGLNPDIHILKFGKRENFWMMGDTGPCGPCSEIHIDLTEKGDTQGRLVNSDSPRCMEIWNLVFMQFNAQADGTFVPLKAKHVDTGMGLERIAGIVAVTKNFSDFSQKPSNYDSDLFSSIFNEIRHLSGKTYEGTVATCRKSMEDQERVDFAFRVVGDHVRALTFAIGDGILPGNEGRHYVLRRILRRAVAFGKRLALPPGSLARLGGAVVGQMADLFPELKRRREVIFKTMNSEEAMFSKTLDRGMLLLENICSKKGIISGHDAFTLYDTYGFPFDLTQFVGKEKGLSIDEEGFQKELAIQQARARNAQKKSQITIASEKYDAATEFVGYHQFRDVRAKILRVVRDGSKCYIVTDRTPFYAEKGGEVGDSGTMICRGAQVNIEHTLYDPWGNILHQIARDGDGIEGEMVVLSIDVDRRREIQRHHSATHILHEALRTIIGDHVKQCGSYVSERGLRFDFNHFTALTREAWAAIEDFVNDAILENLQITAQEMPLKEVPPRCIAHFSEKYGERVRVLSIGHLSMELCGGCHAASTGELGYFKILSESAIAAGVRRIEAVVGKSARKHIRHWEDVIDELERRFSVKSDKILTKVEQLQYSKNCVERRFHLILEKNNRRILDEICRNAIYEGELKKVRGIFEIDSPNDLRSLTTFAITERACDEVVLGGNLGEGAVIAIAYSPAAIRSDGHAALRAKQIAERLSGKGGGSPSFGMVNVMKKLELSDLELGSDC